MYLEDKWGKEIKKNYNCYFSDWWNADATLLFCFMVEKEQVGNALEIGRESGGLLGTITSYLLDKAVLGKECMSGATASKNRRKRNKQTQPLHLARV